jgi:hypothetical protein
MKYKCEICNYETDTQFCFSKHKKTTKHNEKVNKTSADSINIPTKFQPNSEVKIEQQKKVFTCCFCEKTYTTNSNLAKHKKSCDEKNNLIQTYEQTIINYKKESAVKEKLHKKDMEIQNNEISFQKALNDQLKQEIVTLNNVINGSGKVYLSSISALKYAIKKFPEAPQLESVKDFASITYNVPTEDDDNDERFIDIDDQIENNKDDFIDSIICKFEKQTLTRFVGDIIIKTYKKEDKTQQSLWNSDTSRLTYVIRELLNDNKIDWTIDKKGIKTTECIINPLLEYIKKLLNDYIQTNAITNINMIDMKYYEPKLIKMNKLTKICDHINTGQLADGILSYITPNFYLNKEE